MIEEVKKYYMYLNDDEFELLHRICESVEYGYRQISNSRNDGSLWKLTLDEDMIEDITYFLKRERDHQLYDECNRLYAEEIQDLIDDIYYELNYNL